MIYKWYLNYYIIFLYFIDDYIRYLFLLIRFSLFWIKEAFYYLLYNRVKYSIDALKNKCDLLDIYIYF